ncbi:uncharacterized protein LOC127372552 isoform X2 [Dicentrarchus labrax]|uniref:uncharacterized protein LOC127372552 isoform X2 n=1 Tax=Dicentrarchus labrax TaxID=13489 RepID=UPI0021F54BB4|nr:uncharacterized protein LOC127372552 isoform X2 [Dicentrarchus labrax]
MAGHLLFVFLMYSFHKIQVHALHPPKLKVNSLVITETDSVTLSCEAPSSVSVSQCHFYTVSGGTVRVLPCMKTLTGTELLLMSHQSSPAEVEVKCYYTVKIGDLNSPSPHSDISSITIHSQKPQMSLQHFEGEHVLFTCSLPGSAYNDTRCNLYFGEESDPGVTTTIWKKRSSTNQWFCQFTVKIDDLLRRLSLNQQSDASCDYSLGNESSSLSPRSDRGNLTYIVEKESNSGLTRSAVIVTTGLTVSRPHASTPVTPATQTSPNRIIGLTVSRPHASTLVTPATQTSPNRSTGLTVGPSNTDSFISSSLIPVKPASALTLNTASTKASLFPETSLILASETWIRKSVIVVAGFGVTVGVILLGLALFCTKRRTEGCSYKRTQTNVTDDFMYMINLDYEGLFSADIDKAFDVITSLPGVECPTGSDKLDRREPQTEDSDIYHVYCTIPDDQPPSAPNDMVYSTVQTH